ncbi:MAG TPA: MBL fold metallo-hydrolase [Longimicrobium sp.]|nr:MBL fold metallo-hydrolase [Longimicrobium sp.]
MPHARRLLPLLLLPISIIATRPAATAASVPTRHAAAADTIPPDNFDVERIAEGVYAVIRREPAGLWFDANNVFIIDDEGVIVVDSNVSPTSTREVLAALRRLTDRPVTHVINTHWHEDHILGNAVYRDAFPNVEFVAHTTTPEDLVTVSASNRRGALESGASFAAQLRELVRTGRNLAGQEMTDEERPSYLKDASLIERYLVDARDFQPVMPTITVDDRLTLRRRARAIEILHLGAGHTRADLMVHLPAERIAITGDLVVWPVPLVGSTSFPGAFAATLQRVLALRPAIIVPGHGPVLRDDGYVRTVADLLTSIRDQTSAAAARGETLEQARASVILDPFRATIAGDSQLRRFIFYAYVALPGVEAAYREVSTAQSASR